MQLSGGLYNQVFEIVCLDVILIVIKVLIFVEKVQVCSFVNIFQEPVADIVADQSFLDVLSYIMLFPGLFQKFLFLLDQCQLFLNFLVFMLSLLLDSIIIGCFVLLNTGELFLLFDL